MDEVILEKVLQNTSINSLETYCVKCKKILHWRSSVYYAYNLLQHGSSEYITLCENCNNDELAKELITREIDKGTAACLHCEKKFNYNALIQLSSLSGIHNHYMGAVVCSPECYMAFSKESTEKGKTLHFQKICAACGKTKPRMANCARCHVTTYCNRDCQKVHWSKHKAECKNSGRNTKEPQSSRGK